MADQPRPGPQQRPDPSPAAKTTEAAGVIPVVGIGASAGGLEAFSDLLSHLPPNTGMSFVFVQHLDPRHQSLLPELLQPRTSMKVRQVEDGVRPEGNAVYVIPPGFSIEIENRVLRLTGRAAVPNHMPIDSFFRSLALDLGATSIGVVLSGTASDGTVGLKAIKAEGGITFAQEPATAAFDGMPRSAIAAGCVDFVMAPAAIAQELARISRHPYVSDPDMRTAGTDSERDFAEIFNIVRAASNVDFSLYKHGTVRRRIYRRMALHKIESPAQYVKFLRENRKETSALFNDLLISVTSFFREPETFRSLHDRVFPALLQNRAAEDPIRIWIPGCSTGEEAYSIAMAVSEFIEETGAVATVQIFGTDLSEPALERARMGVYPESISSDVSPERLRKFFTKANGHYQVSRAIRDMCIFARQNLTKDPPFSHLDLLVCRNVLIYLGPVLQKRVMKVFHYALKPNGYLVLGASESVGGSQELFAPIDRSAKIYSRRVAPASTNLDFDAYEDGARALTPSRAIPETPFELQKRMDQVLLARYTPAAIVVSRDLRVVQFRGQTGRFLEHASGAANLDLQRMARGGLGAEIRNLLQELESRKSPIEAKVISVPMEEGVADVRLSVSPMNGLPGEPRFLVVFEELRHRAAPENPGAGRTAPPKKSAGSAEARISELEEELSVTRRYLQTVIEDQEAITEELKSANEEIQSSNEELQSTNEELLTAKEELQSTNEELTTVNEEMQNRNDELVRTNNDLLNLLSSVNIPIVMLGSDLKIRRFTPQTERLLNLLPTDAGRPISDFKLKINVPNLEDLVRGVLDNLMPIEREVQDSEGRAFSMWIRPYRTADNKIDGAVLALFDVTDRKHAADARFRRLFESSRDGMVVADHATGVILDINPFAAKLIGKNRGELIGAPVYAVELFANAGIRPETLAELGDNETLRRESTVVRRGGEWCDVEILANAYQESERSVIQFNLRDVTARRLGSMERGTSGGNQDLRALESAGRMAASVSRNFGNDLSTILILCDLLLREHANEPFAADVEKIRDAASRAVAVERQLLAFGRRDTGAKVLVNINQVLDGMGQLIGAVMGDRYTVTNDIDPGLRPVEASYAQIERIILNLLINARRAGPIRGNVSVQTSNITINPDFSAKHPAVRPGEYVSITVTDSTRQTSTPAAADPFALDASQYSGLPAAFEAIREMGAQVWAFSELGVGSTVQVFFPPAAESPRQPAAAEPGDLRGSETILLIDPDEALRTVAARSLEENGYTVLQAPSVDLARGIAQSRNDGIELVVVDVEHGADVEHGGASIRQEASAVATSSNAAIAYISSEPDGVLEAAGVPNDPDTLLRKPYSAEQMAAFVRRRLTRK